MTTRDLHPLDAFAVERSTGTLTTASSRLVLPHVVRWVRTYGDSVSAALFDPACAHFTVAGVDGAFAYKIGWGCAIAIGDPACPREERVTLARTFANAAAKRGLATVFAVVGESFAKELTSLGAAALAFGKDLAVDPRRDPSAGAKGRELRKKLNHARRADLRAGEYLRASRYDSATERQLERVARAWRDHRHGPQVYLTGLRLFEAPAVTRYFYVADGSDIVGALTTIRLDARDGYVIQHVLTTPDAPDGTSELLIANALRTLGDEGCSYATFGPAPDQELGDIVNLPPRSERFARRIFDGCSRTFHLDSRTRYRRKFQIAHEEPSYLVFNPPRVGLGQLGALSRAFNVSWT